MPNFGQTQFIIIRGPVATKMATRPPGVHLVDGARLPGQGRRTPSRRGKRKLRIQNYEGQSHKI